MPACELLTTTGLGTTPAKPEAGSETGTRTTHSPPPHEDPTEPPQKERKLLAAMAPLNEQTATGPLPVSATRRPTNRREPRAEAETAERKGLLDTEHTPMKEYESVTRTSLNMQHAEGTPARAARPSMH